MSSIYLSASKTAPDFLVNSGRSRAGCRPSIPEKSHPFYRALSFLSSYSHASVFVCVLRRDSLLSLAVNHQARRFAQLHFQKLFTRRGMLPPN